MFGLTNAVATARGDAETILEHSPKDSQANGKVERGVRTVEEMTRVHQLQLEHEIGGKMDLQCNAYAWLVEHATDAFNKQHISADGQTGCERLKGNRYRGALLRFGAPAMYRVTGKLRGG